MQVNSNVTINSFENMGAGMNKGPQGRAMVLDKEMVPNSVPVNTPGKYQPQVDYRKALEAGAPPATVVNIGLGQGAKMCGTNSVIPKTTAEVAAPGGNTASDKFLESFSKMLDGFLNSVNKMLDSFLTKMTEVMKPSAQATTQASPVVNAQPVSNASTASTPVSSTPVSSSNTAPVVNRTMQSWEAKANQYLQGDDKGMVAESDLQEAVVKYQFYQKSDQAEGVFVSELEKAKAMTTNRQNAIKAALRNTVASGAVTQAEADYVYSIAFKASQFDADVDKISTAKSTGGLSVINAVQLAAVNLTMIRAGDAQYQARSINTAE